MSIYLVEATIHDCDLFYQWANDETVRQSSFNTNMIKYEDHKDWFSKKVDSTNSYIFICYLDGLAIGQIRIDIKNDSGNIDYSIAKEYRGKGYGALLLKEMEKLVLNSKIDVRKLIGRVKYSNISSQKAFQRAGYLRRDKKEYVEYFKTPSMQLDEGDRRIMERTIKLNGRTIGEGHPCYVIAEMSANHAGSLDRAFEIIQAAKEAGADCIKIQTYTPDTITIDCDNDFFKIKQGTWKDNNLYNLYAKAFTPWEWQSKLKKKAQEIGIDFLSTPFDRTAVDFLESIGIEFYKIASFELIDLPLIKYIASKGKPMIISTGMGSYEEIQEAVEAAASIGNDKICLLKCSSVYPAVTNDMNLKTIQHMHDSLGFPIGLSDHSLGSVAAITAVALGAKLIEKHLCISRTIENPDASFSMEPDEFKKMVEDIRATERAIGKVSYEVSDAEKSNAVFRKSIFVVDQIKKGETFTEENIRVIRPGHGIKPKYFEEILGKKARVDIERGTPLQFNMIQ